MRRAPDAPRTVQPWPALLLGLVLALVVVAVGAPTAGAQTTTQTTTQNGPRISASLVAISPQVRGTDPWRIELQVTGAAPTDLVRVRILDRAPEGSSREALRKIVDGTQKPTGGNLYAQFTKTVGELTDPNRSTLVLSPTAIPETPGVYPVDITVGAPGASNTIITWLVRIGATAAGTQPFTVSFVVPVRSPIADQPDGTTVLNPTEVARLDSLATIIENAPTGSMTVVPNPETLDALSGSDPTAIATLTHLQQASSDDLVLAAPFVPIDIDVWRRAGREDYVSLMLREGRDSLTKTLARAATNISSRTAVLDPFDTAASLDSLRREGAVNAIVPAPQLEGLRNNDFPSPFAQTFRIRDSGNQDVPAASADPWLADAVVQLDRGTDAGRKAQEILADLAAGYFDRPSAARGSVILLPDGWAPNTDVVLTSLLAPLGTSSVVKLRTIDGFFDTVSRSHPDNERSMETLVSGPMRRTLVSTRGPDVDALARDLDEARAALESYEAIFGTAAATRTTQFDELLLASSDDRLSATQHRAYIDATTAFVTQSVRTTGGRIAISAPESERFTLTSRREKIRIVLDNELAAPANVRIDLRSEKLTFPEGESIATTLQPGSNVIEFDVSVKTSGDSLLEYTVNAPEGSLGELARGKLRVRAWALSGLGVILSSAAILVLVTWWVRHALRTRRARRTTVATVAT